MDGTVIGIQKNKIERYKKIVKGLLNKEELSDLDKEFLIKEKILGERH